MSSLQEKAEHSIVNDMEAIKRWGWDEDRLIQEIVKFRHETMKELPSEFQPNHSELKQIMIDLPDSWRILATEPGRIDGFWHFVPLGAEQFERAKKGYFHYGVLKRRDVLPLDEPLEMDILFLSLSVRESVRQATLSMYLLTSYLECLTRLAEQGVFVRHMCCNLGTTFARRLNIALVLGLEYIGDHQVAGYMYLCHLPDIWDLPQYKLSPADSIQHLRRMYREHYNTSDVETKNRPK